MVIIGIVGMEDVGIDDVGLNEGGLVGWYVVGSKVDVAVGVDDEQFVPSNVNRHESVSGAMP